MYDLCASCGLGLSGEARQTGVCAHHPMSYGDEWAAVNRAYCDYFHRGIPIPHVADPDISYEYAF